MPVSSVIIGVDLVAIRPISNVITLQQDITTDSCRVALKKELKTWKADLVLNDGAPNVGKSWLHDAYTQNRLTLSALKLASEFLMRGGTFVTKVFRSKDYNALIWVLSKLFKKVSATKPQASRNESAEIFVVCLNYLAPDKIDPKFFNPNFLFEDMEENEKKKKVTILQPISKQKKAKAEGYEEGISTLHKKIKASDFMKSNKHLEMLSEANEMIIDMDQMVNHPLTTDELKECCKDIKVLGRRDLLMLINWRRKLKKELFKKDEKEVAAENLEEVDVDQDVPEELNEGEEEAKRLKKKKKKLLKERKKNHDRMNLKMVIKNDQLVEEDAELFNLAKLKSKYHVEEFEEFSLSESDDDEKIDGQKEPAKVAPYERDDENREYGVSDGEQEENDEDDDDGFDDDEAQDADANGEDDEDVEDNELIQDLGTKPTKNEKKNMFFKKGIFQELENDEEDNDSDDDDFEYEVLKEDDAEDGKSGRKVKKNLRNDSSDSDSDDSDADEPVKKRHPKCQEDIKLDAEGLALAEKMITSSKVKRDLMDDAWNRYVRGEDEDLPSWFRKDEEKFWCKQLPVDPAVVAKYKDRMKELNVRPIKKVAEAKARKKKRALLRMEKMKKRAETISDTPDMGEKEKAVSLRKYVFKIFITISFMSPFINEFLFSSLESVCIKKPPGQKRRRQLMLYRKRDQPTKGRQDSRVDTNWLMDA